MWSYEVSQMVGSFQQQSLVQAGYANSIGMMNPGFAGNTIAGSALNMAGSIAGPAASVGLGLFGADPISLGVSTGIAAFPTMGLGGAMAAGIGVAAPMAVGMYGAQAIGQQVMTGMQQQQQLATGLRASMGGFMNRGMGPSNADITMIGNQIRSMTHQQGAGGEIYGFNELSSLAQNMGQMGFVQKAQDVKQFSQKFREMVETLKTVARDLGTSLEAAQQAVVGMRGSGIFNSADQLRMSSAMRSAAVTGNISMTESSAMANIGSQIARSIGGRGISGAFGGVKTLGQIGQAVQMGVLSEEDIYNATGLTGVEGQRAVASNMMQSSARFLRSGRGRFLLAAMANSNGQINDKALDEFMDGGMGVGRTRELAGAGLRRTGIANFLRNEGRLASGLLEKVGGNVNVMSLMGWAGQHGIDIESMGDREMIFAQRQLGMGRDDLELAVTMARKLPEMREMARMREGQDKYLTQLRTQQGRTGLEGVKNDFNMFREKIQGSLQKVGQDIYSDASDYVERYIRKITGEVSSAMTDQLDEAVMRYRAEGAAGGRGTSEVATVMRNAKNFGFLGDSLLKGGMSDYDAYRKRAQSGGFSGALSRLFGGKSLEERTGISVPEGASEATYNQIRSRTDAIRAGATTPADAAVRELTASAAKGLAGSIGFRERLAGASGDKYLDIVEEVVGKYGDQALKTQWSNLRSGVPGEERNRALGQLAQTITGQAGLGDQSQFVAKYRSPFAFEGGAFTTEKERLSAYGDRMFSGYADSRQLNRTLGETVEGVAFGGGAYLYTRAKESLRAAATPMGALRSVMDPLGLYTAASRELSGQQGINRDVQLSAAKYLRTDEGRRRLGGLHDGTASLEDVAAAQRRMEDLLGGKGVNEMSSDQRGEYEALKTAVTANKLRGMESDTDREAYVKEAYQGKMTLGQFQRQQLGQESAIGAESIESAAAIIRRSAGLSSRELESYRAAGIYNSETGGLTKASAKRLAGSPHLAKILSSRLNAMSREVSAGEMANTPAGIGQFLAAGEDRAAAQSSLWSMSSEQLGRTIQDIQSGKIEGPEGDMMLGELRRTKSTLDKTRRLVGGRGANLAAASMLGLNNLSQQDMLDLRGAKDSASFVNRLKGMGIELSTRTAKDLEHAVTGLRTGEYSEMDDATGKVKTYSGAEGMQRARNKIEGIRSGELAEKQKEMNRKQQEQDNPLLADIKGILDTMVRAQDTKSQAPRKVYIEDWSGLKDALKK